MPIAKVTRRQVLIGAGGAVAVAGGTGVWLAIRRVRSWRFRNPADRGNAFAPNVYLAVEPGGDVVIWLTRAEMGQGVATALPMIVAEELDADWSRVRVEQAVLEPGYDYGPMFTAASASVRSLWTELRRAGAAARHMIVSAAAEMWGVPADQITTKDSRVLHEPSGRAATYGELAERAATRWPPLRPRLKDPSEFRLLGRSVPRVDLPAKIAGTAVFGLDVRVADMLYAVIARSPTLGGRVRVVDDSAARGIGGIQDVLRVPAGIAVVATNTYAALRARDALRIEWEAGPGTEVSSADIASALRERLQSSQSVVARDDGGVVAALNGDRPAATAVYEVPYLAHAPMEPMNCVARVSEGQCTVWAPTQAPDAAREVAARVAQLPLERVTVHTTYLGGGFGRRAASDFVAEAVDLSVRIGKPVQVVWSREDDLRHGLYRDAAAQRIDAVVDDEGLPIAWRHKVASVSAELPEIINTAALMGADDLPYAVDQVRVEWVGLQAPIPTSIWRSVGHSYTTFAIECFIDELAHPAGHDPAAYRARLLSAAPRLRRCIADVTELCGWTRAEPRWLGIAAARCFGSHVALVAELLPSSGNSLHVANIWCVVDCGIVVNPDSAAAQIEGGILFGLTAALYGHVTVSNGAIVEDNFDRYRLLRLDETPEITVQFVSSAEPPGGVGELGVPAVAPAVANAFFAARGERIRKLPISFG